MTSRQFIKGCLFFGFLALILYALHFAIVFGVKHSESGRIGKINQIMLHKIDKEIVVFGASEGETGINPMALERKLDMGVFNMAMDGTTISQYGDIVKEFNKYSQKNQYVILALGIFCLQDREMPASPNWYYSWKGNEYIAKNQLLNKLEEFRRYKHLPFYGFVLFNSDFYRSSFDGWRNLISDKVSNSCYDNGGWVAHDLAWGENNSLQALTPQRAFLNETILLQYRDVIKELNAKDKKVILVFMPSWKGARDYYMDYDKLKEKLRSLAGVQNFFLDYSDIAISDSKDYFYNYTHLNKKGAEAFSDTLADDVAALINTKKLPASQHQTMQ